MQKVHFWLFLFLALEIGCKTPYQHTTDIHEIKKDSSGVNKIDAIQLFVYPIKEVATQLGILLNDQSTSNNYAKLCSIYKVNNNKPFWTTVDQQREGLMLIESCIFHGLNPQDYNSEQLNYLFQKLVLDTVFNVKKHAEFDVKLTQGVIKFIDHLQNGKLNPKDYNFSWNYPLKSNVTNDTVLKQLIVNKRINEIETFYEPQFIAYKQLKIELKKLLRTNKEFSDEFVLKYPGFLNRPGDSNAYILSLKHKLKQKGYIKQDTLGLKFNAELEQALKAFQQKHGLTPDGLPGKRTYTFLNWTKENYVNTLKINLERLRWLSQDLPENYLWVNIPAYKMQIHANGTIQGEARIIVGKYKNQTPVFQSAINYLVFNPCWTVPNSITSKSILPRLKKDSTYLKTHNMFLGENGVEVSSKGVDFSKFTKKNFPYKIYQRTGGSNALGKVKFMFANKYSIYLHDTPSQNLFAKDYRALSHGCVRVQNAIALAEYILFDLDDHKQTIAYYLKKGYPEKVYLQKKLPLMIHYFTCAYNENIKQVVFYNDVYARDNKVLVDLRLRL